MIEQPIDGRRWKCSRVTISSGDPGSKGCSTLSDYPDVETAHRSGLDPHGTPCRLRMQGLPSIKTKRNNCAAPIGIWHVSGRTGSVALHERAHARCRRVFPWTIKDRSSRLLPFRWRNPAVLSTLRQTDCVISRLHRSDNPLNIAWSRWGGFLRVSLAVYERKSEVGTKRIPYNIWSPKSEGNCPRDYPSSSRISFVVIPNSNLEFVVKRGHQPTVPAS